MRSTICIDLWRHGAALLASAVLATGAAAQALAPACYERIYSEAHLDSHPDQVVWQIRLRVGAVIGPAERAAQLEVVAANQGHARANDNHGRVLTQFLICGDRGARPECQVECDGGAMQVTRLSPGSLTFRTDYLLVGEGAGCGGIMDLAEKPGQAVSYRLDRVPDATCGHME